MPSSRRRFSLFGEIVETDFDFGFELAASQRRPDLRFDRRIGETPAAWTGVPTYHDGPTPDQSSVVLRIGDGYQLLSFGDVSDFRLERDRIQCFVRSDELDYLVPIQFLGHVMALWLETKGVLALHGAGVATDAGVVGFIGGKGAGKTGITAGLLQAGHRFVTDDILAVTPGSATSMVSPSYPHLRMEPDLGRGFFGDEFDRFDLVHPSFEKRRVPIASLDARMVDEPSPLRALIVLAGSDSDDRPRRLTQLEAVEELLKHSFIGAMLQQLPRERQRLAVLAEVGSSVPVIRAATRLLIANGNEKPLEEMLGSVLDV